MEFSTIILVVIAALFVWFVFLYNKFVRLITRAKEAWSDIEVQMKRRFDLIPNFVSTVKGYASHEAGLLEKVTEARARVAQGGTAIERAGA